MHYSHESGYTYNEFSIRLLVIMRAEKNERDVTEPKLRVVTFFVESQISQKIIRSMISFDDQPTTWRERASK